MKIHAQLLVGLMLGGQLLGQEPDVSALVLGKAASKIRLLSASAAHSLIRENAIKTPQIRSHWHNVSQGRQTLPQEQAKRDFAQSLSGALTRSAAAIRSEPDLKKVAFEVEALLDLANWLAHEESYGTLLLSARCHDIASVGIGRLLLDLNYPNTRINALLARLNVPWYSAATRARVLNQELAAPVFSTNGNDGDIEKRLSEVWSAGVIAELRQRNPSVGRGDRIDKLLDTNPLIRSNAAFFATDSVSGAKLDESWTFKLHDRFVYGLKPDNVSRVRALATFRTMVGGYPETPRLKNHGYATEQAAAFAEAWEPHAKVHGDEHLDVIAWHAFDALRNGRFTDADSSP
jgi:hypothetical protein